MGDATRGPRIPSGLRDAIDDAPDLIDNLISDATRRDEAGAKRGSPKSLYNLGLRHYMGDGVEQNYSRAFEYFMQAAKLGEPKAQCNLGSMYEEGLGVGKDIDQALHWLDAAAKQDHGPSHMFLAELFEDDGREVPQDLAKAVHHYERAKRLGVGDAAEPLARARRLLKSQSGNKRSAGKKGKRKSKAKSGRKKKRRKTFEQELEAAMAGGAKAQFNVGVRYYNGDGVGEDLKMAAFWFAHAADQGDLNALYNYALMLDEGEGVDKNPTEALRLFTVAAQKGHPQARQELGLNAAPTDVAASGGAAAEHERAV